MNKKNMNYNKIFYMKLIKINMKYINLKKTKEFY